MKYSIPTITQKHQIENILKMVVGYFHISESIFLAMDATGNLVPMYPEFRYYPTSLRPQLI